MNKTLTLHNLTHDEDVRQDVLMYMLTGDPVDVAIKKAINNKIINDSIESNKILLDSILDSSLPTYKEIIQLPEKDRIILLMMFSGIDIEFISEYNNVSCTYVSNLVDIIGTKNGTKKKLNRS